MKNDKVCIVGGGPAGVSCAIYLKRYGMTPTIFEKEMVGGKTNQTERIENFPGFLLEKGPELADILLKQVKKMGIDLKYEEVKELREENGKFIVKTRKGESEYSYAVVANGLVERPYHLEGEEAFSARGISRCAICDGPFYKGKDVVVIGSGNAAFEEANYLATICSKVTLLARREQFRADKEVIEKFKKFDNTQILAPYEAVSCRGTNSLESITVRSNKDGSMFDVPCSGMFVYIGAIPKTEFIQIEDVKNENGYVESNPSTMETRKKGLYAIGDCRTTPLRQVTMAVGDGSLAATSIHDDYMRNMNKEDGQG